MAAIWPLCLHWPAALPSVTTVSSSATCVRRSTVWMWQSLLDRFRSTPQVHTVLLLGWPGKTTFLHRMARGELIEPASTIGFNIQNLETSLAAHPGPPLKLNVFDIGGCNKISALVRHFMTEDLCGIIFLVDPRIRNCTTVDGLWNDNLELLDFFVGDERVAKNTPVAVMIPFQDLPESQRFSNESIRELIYRRCISLRGRQCQIFPCSIVEWTGIQEAWDWFSLAVHTVLSAGTHRPSNQQSKQQQQQEKSAERESPASSSSMSLPSVEENTCKSNATDGTLHQDPALQPGTADSILVVPSDKCSDEEFLSSLHDATLPDFSHKTHLRIAFLLLQRHPRRTAVQLVMDSIEQFIARRNAADHGPLRKTFHLTLTYFWLQFVHLAMSMGALQEGDDALQASFQRLRFERLLASHRYLLDGALCLRYYSRDLLFQNPEARVAFLPPDIQPLPSTLSDLSVKDLHA